MKIFWLLCLTCVPLMAAEPTLVYLVRHAEKVDGSRDADLSERGLRRADELADLLDKVALDQLIATEYQRTRKTLVPLARRKGLEVTVIEAGKPQELLAHIRAAKGQTLVVAGHSNTVPHIIEELGGPALHIDEGTYRNLFLLVLTENSVKLQNFQLVP